MRNPLRREAGIRGFLRSRAVILPVMAAAAGSSCGGPARTNDAAVAPSAGNLRLVGYDDLQGRSAYQPVIHPYGDRRILFVGHHAGEALNPATGQVEVNGLSIVDVTDPAVPEYLVHVPPTGAEANGTQHVQVCSGSTLPNADPDRVYLMRTNGNLSYEVLDVTDPREPRFVTMIARTGVSARSESQRGNRETHKSQWDCDSGVAYLNGTPAGWRVTRVLQAFDLADPTQPGHIRNFGLVGHEPTARGPFPEAQVAGLHQPFVNGDRMYLGYNSGGDGVLQILDRGRFLSGDPSASDGRAPTATNLLYPEIARFDMPPYYGVHTAKPVYNVEITDYADNRDLRALDLLLVVSESGSFRCQENRDAMFIFDITVEARPLPISTFQVPEAAGDFCNTGGRFGPHSLNDSYHPGFDKKLVVLAYFNAGIRVIDIRNPYAPVEVGHFIPETNANTTPSCIEISGVEECDTAIQTNNVDLDDRGYIYAVDRASTGLVVLELTGAARSIAGLGDAP